MLVKGFDKESYSCAPEKLFKDVPVNHWASNAITIAVRNDLLKGYPNGTFLPNNNVTRVEALCALSKGINCENIDKCKAQEILSKYSDGSQIPDWAQIPIAKALDKGALNNSPNPNKINPFAEATRADIAAMLQNIRVAAGIDKNPVTANNDCPTCPLDKKAFVEEEEAKMDQDLVQKAFESMKVVDIMDIPTDTTKLKTEIEVVSELSKSDIIIDVRAPDDVEKSPINWVENEVVLMPFYKTATNFHTLDQTKTYALYCDQGVMSNMQTRQLKEKGYHNVKVYRPAK